MATLVCPQTLKLFKVIFSKNSPLSCSSRSQINFNRYISFLSPYSPKHYNDPYSAYSNLTNLLHSSSKKECQDSKNKHELELNEIFKRDLELQDLMKDIQNDFSLSGPGDLNFRKERHQVPEESTTLSHNGDPQLSIPLSRKLKFEVYNESQAEEILESYEEEEQGNQLYLYQEKVDPLQGFKQKRGEKGVFDIAELVTVLQQENGQEIAVIAVSKELHYCDYMVLVTAKSPRHLKAIVEFIRKLHKKKRTHSDAFIVEEGKNCNDWQVIDLGNIVLHLFLEEIRLHYDLENLWTVGEEYDDLSKPTDDPVMDLLQQHVKYLDSIETFPASKT